jgi:hypothetical protein
MRKVKLILSPTSTVSCFNLCWYSACDPAGMTINDPCSSDMVCGLPLAIRFLPDGPLVRLEGAVLGVRDTDKFGHAPGT